MTISLLLFYFNFCRDDQYNIYYRILILEIIKKTEIKQDVAKEEVTQTIAQSTPVTPTVEAPKVEQPVVQEPAPQVQSTPVEQNVFNTSFNPNSEFTGNIFDMPPQTNTESSMKL